MGLLLVGLCRHDCSRLQQNPAAERTISCSPLEGKSWFLFPSLPAQPPKPIVLSLAICLSISLTSYLSFIFFFFWGRHFFFISSTFIFLTFISASLFLTLIFFFANIIPPISNSIICCWLCTDFWPLSNSDSRGTDRDEAGRETGKDMQQRSLTGIEQRTFVVVRYASEPLRLSHSLLWQARDLSLTSCNENQVFL